MNKVKEALAVIGGCFIGGIVLGTAAFYIKRTSKNYICTVLDDDAGDEE